MSVRVLLAIAIVARCCVAFAQDLPEIYRPDPEDEHPWADIDLRIESLTCSGQSRCTVRARGSYHGKPVGLEVVVGAVDGGRQGISYRSIGEDSDRLVQALSELYKRHYRSGSQPFVPVSMKPAVFADTIFLEGDLSTLKTQGAKIKAFFNADGPESKYAELYTNVDPAHGILEIHEKDIDFRENVIQALASSSTTRRTP